MTFPKKTIKNFEELKKKLKDILVFVSQGGIMVKTNNHLLPRMVIKRWEEHNGKIYDKIKNKIRKVGQLDYSEKYYYSLGKIDDTLENRISHFERYIGNLLKELDEAIDSIELSEKDMEILKLYVFLQSCRNNNTSPYILSDESGLYKNNEYIFGVPLVSTQESAVSITSRICDEFERINRLDKNAKYSYDYRFLTGGEINSPLLWGLHLVIVNNKNNAFLVSETTSIIECSIDNNFMFAYVPVSPKIGLILAKSKYFYDMNQIEYTKVLFGRKYGNYYPDPRLSEVICDKKLTFNGSILDGKVKIKFNELSKVEVYNLNSVIYEDGNNILFSSEEALKDSKLINPKRQIILI